MTDSAPRDTFVFRVTPGPVNLEDLPRRTALQQLSNIYHEWRKKRDLRLALEEAFNVEAVTTAFFKQYRDVFERVQGLVKGFPLIS